MGQTAAKQGDRIVGLDTHVLMVPSPGGPVPTPTPMPFQGILDGALSVDVVVEGKSAATKDSTASNTPAHVPTAGPFQKPPTNNTVINGKPAARRHCAPCNDTGDAPNGTLVADRTAIVG